ncbi:Polypeptide n-acetylgalactosaminyltransferase 9 [Gryllus bimaculatus]|nr:Polypeptide n-acetylgalactosaminyltransferase 9 [Gryllus bimaculatus]
MRRAPSARHPEAGRCLDAPFRAQQVRPRARGAAEAVAGAGADDRAAAAAGVAAGLVAAPRVNAPSPQPVPAPGAPPKKPLPPLKKKNAGKGAGAGAAGADAGAGAEPDADVVGGVLVAPRDGPAALLDGPGENGRPVVLPANMSADMKRLVDEGWLKNAFNQYASDLISVRRKLPDPRDACIVVHSHHSFTVFCEPICVSLINRPKPITLVLRRPPDRRVGNQSRKCQRVRSFRDIPFSSSAPADPAAAPLAAPQYSSRYGGRKAVAGTYEKSRTPEGIGRDGPGRFRGRVGRRREEGKPHVDSYRHRQTR